MNDQNHRPDSESRNFSVNPLTEMTSTIGDVSAICVRRAIDCIGREYPNHPQTLLTDASDLKSPQAQTPAFFGCFDWHSAVHAHWLLVRMLCERPSADWADEAHATLCGSLTNTNLLAEHHYISKPGREGFERPYGLAWLLQLAAELRRWPDPAATSMALAIRPLERLCRDRLADWLTKLSHPIRTGEHSQSAFAMGLAHDWARVVGDEAFLRVLKDRAGALYGEDRNLPIVFEPSGHDFLSPALAEVDLMRRVMPSEEFPIWFAAALPMKSLAELKPVVPPDRADGKLAHLDGLNLSRAWMLAELAEAVGVESPLGIQLTALAAQHQTAGRSAIASNHYAGTHWLGTFFVYGATRRIDQAGKPGLRCGGLGGSFDPDEL